MTLANKITIGRILLIPVFVLVTLGCIRDFQTGEVKFWQPYLAFAIFTLAAVSDAVDGYIARRYNQKSELGTLLDPLADKALLVSALVLLSIRFKDGSPFDRLPLWFVVLIISREVILVSGALLIHMVAGRLTARPRIVGKCATFFQMFTLGWVLLKLPTVPFQIWLYAAGICTLASGLWYVYDGVKQLNVLDTKK